MQNVKDGHSGAKRKARGGRKSTTPPPAPVTVTRVDPRALKTAQAIVAGYAGRGFTTHVAPGPDGAVYVENGR